MTLNRSDHNEAHEHDVTDRKTPDELFTDLKRLEGMSRFLVLLDDVIRPLTDAEEITFTAAKALGQHLSVNRCAYATVEDDEDTFILTGNYNNGVESIVGRYTFRQFGAECLRLMRAGEPYAVTDSETDPRVTDAERPSYRLTAIRAVICVPILKQGRFVAAMAVHAKATRSWLPDEVKLVQQVASRCWESIERARVTQSLRDSEHQFRELANSIPNLAFMAKPDGSIYWYNEQWYAYTGTTPAEVQGWGWQRVHDPDVLPEVNERWSQSLTTGTPFEMVFPLRGADGQFRRFLTRVNPVRDPRGQIVRWFGSSTDVEDERRATEANAIARNQINELREAAEAANRAKDEFLAMLGHELRNPLSPILTALQLMKLRGGDGFERERTVIERQVNHLTRLVDDLLDVSRIARGKVELKAEIVEMAEVVSKAIEMASPLLERRTHALTVDVPSRGLAIEGDPTRLSQVVSNLLTNAAKYTPPGGHIAVLAGEDGGDIVLRVRDTGIGIAPDVLPRVFDLFVQEPQAIDRSLGGLGLGLTIVKNLVERHGGSVSAHSEGRGRGSEFVVRLPKLNAASARCVARPPTPVPVEPADAPAAACRILVVDDNEDGADTLAEVLSAQGYVTRVAHDAPAALRIAEEFAPDIAFLDIGLPVMDGYELAARLRGIGALSGIKLIALTGYGQESDRQKTRAAGFHHHLVKPVDLDALEAVVRSYLPEPAAS
jgi:PAS domain S-box-containing protein